MDWVILKGGNRRSRKGPWRHIQPLAKSESMFGVLGWCGQSGQLNNVRRLR